MGERTNQEMIVAAIQASPGFGAWLRAMKDRDPFASSKMQPWEQRRVQAKQRKRMRRHLRRHTAGRWVYSLLTRRSYWVPDRSGGFLIPAEVQAELVRRLRDGPVRFSWPVSVPATVREG